MKLNLCKEIGFTRSCSLQKVWLHDQSLVGLGYSEVVQLDIRLWLTGEEFGMWNPDTKDMLNLLVHEIAIPRLLVYVIGRVAAQTGRSTEKLPALEMQIFVGKKVVGTHLSYPVDQVTAGIISEDFLLEPKGLKEWEITITPVDDWVLPEAVRAMDSKPAPILLSQLAYASS